MFEVDVNIWAVLVATIVYFVIGALWYSVLFGKQWMKLSGITKESMEGSGRVAPYVATLLLLLILSYVLAHMVAFADAATIGEGMTMGAWLWLGFVATIMLIDAIYAGRSYKLTAINAGYHLVGMMAAAAIISAWA